MAELEDAIVNRIKEDVAMNDEYKLFMEQDNYISEVAIQYVLFLMDYYIKNGGEASVANIRHMFGMSESKAELTIETLKDMGLIEKSTR